MKNDEWRPIVGYEKTHEVSSSGLVRRIPSIVFHRKNGQQRMRGYILKQSSTPNGYAIVHLAKDGKSTPKTVHRLVALAFLPKPNHATQVNHKNCDKKYNDVNNLEWVTAKENKRHAMKNGRDRWSVKK